MAVTYNKPPHMKYTDMCIYIDANMWRIANVGEFPEVEQKIYEYLYHITYALSRKGAYFQSFDDYNGYALYAAGELYLSIRNKLINAGKEVRGKTIIPIKNTLDFIKSVMLPLKVDYQKQEFACILGPKELKNSDTLDTNLRESIKSDYRESVESDLKEIFENLPYLIFKKVLWKTPYKYDPVFLQKLYISCMLTFITQVTFPRKMLNKLSKKKNSNNQQLMYLQKSEPEVILWHLDPKYKDYVQLLTVEIKHVVSDAYNESRSYSELDDELVDSIMKSAYANYDPKDGE